MTPQLMNARAAWISLLFFMLPTTTRADGPGITEAVMFAQAGEYEEAARIFLAVAEKASQPREALKAKLNAASCLKLTGNLCSARSTLTSAVAQVTKLDDPVMQCLFLAELGSVLSVSSDSSQAEPVLQRAARAASDLGNQALLAEIYNDQAVASASLNQPRAAFHWADLALTRATTLGLPDLVTRSRQNRLIAAFMIWKADHESLRRIRKLEGWDEPMAKRLAESRSIFEECLTSTRLSSPTGFEAMTAGKAAVRYGMKKEGFKMLRDALDWTRSTSQPRLERSCLLILAELYLDHHRHQDAATILNQVRTIPGQTDSVQKAQLEILTAIQGEQSGEGPEQLRIKCERAVRYVDGMRSDLSGARLTTDLGRSFREMAGIPYMMLAELELADADPTAAIAAIEAFKSRELEDFYRNDCINASLEKQQDLRSVDDDDTAVFYAIAFPERLELIVVTSEGTTRRTSSIRADELHALTRKLRHHLEFDHGTYAFMQQAETLHQHLISPLTDLLRKQNIKHLVFVPDGPLATIPLAVIHDPIRRRYLIQDYSLSVAPGMSLMRTETENPGERGILLGGLTRSFEGFAALPAVEDEVSTISKLYQQTLTRTDEAFTRKALRRDLQAGGTGLVHLATHAEFAATAGGTFLLASDGPVSIGELEAMIRPRKFTGVPVELLCLSACRTAAGDDRAALGLAGAAVKSGARSVLASLWYVDDQAASSLMVEFHKGLSSGLGKSRAIQAAQLEVLEKDPLSHPYRWAPFIMIGDWK